MIEQIKYTQNRGEAKENKIDPQLKMLLRHRDEILAMLNDIKDEPKLEHIFEQFSDGLDKLNAYIRIVENRSDIGEHKSDN